MSPRTSSAETLPSAPLRGSTALRSAQNDTADGAEQGLHCLPQRGRGTILPQAKWWMRRSPPKNVMENGGSKPPPLSPERRLPRFRLRRRFAVRLRFAPLRMTRQTVSPSCIKAGGVRSATKGGAAVALALLQSRRCHLERRLPRFRLRRRFAVRLRFAPLRMTRQTVTASFAQGKMRCLHKTPADRMGKLKCTPSPCRAGVYSRRIDRYRISF